ncbi:hypothetical protein [Actinomadura sp. 7K534]|uniref:hypothetical protein n=1 Tax=Actinomadura sp. 7K534 TaxID=2530366 RepID=UPI001053A6D5|nr:hypothetical protein [Actinomadura sp. 7K534]TDB99306.1 hypothetical protein E1266_00505 [Actinomadura sp. 7K534]
MPPQSFYVRPLAPRHRHCIALDVSRFSALDVAGQAHVRTELFAITEGVAADLQVNCRPGVHSDRGDGLMLVTDCGIEVLVTDFPRRLGDAVRRYNEDASPDVRVQLRQALDAGYVHQDDRGYAGVPLNRAARLLDAPEFKAKMMEHGAEFAVIISTELYEEIQEYHLLDERKLEKVQVDVKETHTMARMWIP